VYIVVRRGMESAIASPSELAKNIAKDSSCTMLRASPCLGPSRGFLYIYFGSTRRASSFIVQLFFF